ncbi:MAG TPA: TlpA disulfide reductase family protein [Candidatus Binatia bacterium]|nr:TlpA disulfide reductase family protein [Candidatus Binatia bacterium]
MRIPDLTLATLQGEKLRLRPEPPGVRLLLVYKRDCETCGLVLPVLERLSRPLHARGLETIGVSQSDADATLDAINEHGLCFPQALDSDLALSFALEMEVVPAVVLVDAEGEVLDRTDALDLDALTRVLHAAGDRAGVERAEIDRALAPFRLPSFRPGCASRTLDAGVQRRRDLERGRGRLAARRFEVGDDEDEHEALFARGVTDGLPVVPPTEERVIRMLAGTPRDPQDVVALVPPNLAPATIEKIAINAVMAGCKPEYLPVVIAAVEAACTDEFNMHGVLATTYFAAPLVIVNGPIRKRIGLNSGINVFGQGHRANATIGRALNLVVRNVGGGRPGEVDRATLGQPGKFTYCIAENEEASPWPPLHVERGFAAEDSTVTLFAAEAPRAIVDQTSRTAAGLVKSLGLAMESVAHPRAHGYGDIVLVLPPEHVATIRRDGWTKDDVRRRIQEVTARPLAELFADEECREGLPRALAGNRDPATVTLPKFRSSEMIHIVVAGGPAGKFSAVIGGWVQGPMGSTMVTRKIG